MSTKVAESAFNPALAESSFVHTPLRHTRVLFATFLQGLFGGMPPGYMRWDADPEQSEIVIRDENPLRVESVGQRPALNFTMGAVQFYSLGLDDMMFYDQDTGRKTKSVLVPGTMSINCCSRVDLEAHDLAWFVAEYVWLLRDEFMRRGFFEIGRGNQITPPSPAGSIIAGDLGDEWYCSSVVVPFQINRKSAVTPLGKHIVQNVSYRLRVADPPRVVGSKGYPVPGEAPQVHEQRCMPPSQLYGPSDMTDQNSTNLPLQPHPLNPTALVSVRTTHANRPGPRGPSIYGRQLPIPRRCRLDS